MFIIINISFFRFVAVFKFDPFYYYIKYGNETTVFILIEKFNCLLRPVRHLCSLVRFGLTQYPDIKISN